MYSFTEIGCIKSGILVLAFILAVNVIDSQAEQVRAYQRKDGTQVSSYDRNSSRAVAPFAGSSSPGVSDAPASSNSYNDIYSAKQAQQSDGNTEEVSPKTSTATIISNSWESDTLNVYGSLTNLNVTLKIIGYDKNRQIVTESSDYNIESTGIFHAKLRDAKKEINFVKVLLADKTADKTADSHRQATALDPVATITLQPASTEPLTSVPASANSFGAVFVGLMIAGIILATLWLVIKAAFSFSNLASNQSVPLPPPTPSESEHQELALAELGRGAIPNQYKLDGFLPKKGENVIWAFPGTKHYRQGTHSEWVGQSSGASVRIMKGLWVRGGGSRGHRVSYSAMDDQGEGTLVLTTMGVCFVGTNSARIPLSHILAFQSYTDGIGFDTDYARNNRHVFVRIHPGNVAFIATALEIIKAA